MKLFKFLLSLALTAALVFVLETKFGSVPPLGKFLNPVGGFWQNAEKTENQFIDIGIGAGVNEQVQILFDENLIPHIYANNDYDLYFAQGYVMAQFRLWQMEFQTRAAAGRLSEIIGPDAIEFDRLQRRKGMGFAAENSLREGENDGQFTSIMQAYSDGANHYINSLDYANLPIEYKLLGYEPEEWSPYKSALFLKYMADMLSASETDLENTNFVELFGKERYDFLFPEVFDSPDPIIPSSTVYDFEPIEVKEPLVKGFPWSNTDEIYEKPDPLNGSNNWAVSGSKTRSGNPILAGDPHLGLNLPSIWYSLHLNAPGVNVMGAGLPGAPGVIIGFNDNIAWSVTNAQRDAVDWYKIQFRDESRQEYFFNNTWLKTQMRIEEVKVLGGETYVDTVIYTHHGPVVYDHSFNQKEQLTGFAMRWIAHQGSKEVIAFHQLNRAKNYTEYTEALKNYGSPAQNFVFASNQGDIALWVQGKFPIKWEGQGKFLMDGTQLDHDWQGFIPMEQNAHVLNPERGFVSSANQHPHDTTYPYWSFDSNFEAWRNRRINSRLTEMNNISVSEIMALQNDNFNLKASETLPLLIEMTDGMQLNLEQSDVLDLAKNWDYFNDIESKGASVWEIWWDKIRKMANEKFRDSAKPLKTVGERRFQELIAEYPEDEIFDLPETSQKETATEIVQQALLSAIDSLQNWSAANDGKEYAWANFKNTTVQHLLPPLTPFTVSGVQVGGNRSIINATGPRHGASWRMVVELGSKPTAFGVYPGGQSGNPGSKFYDNMIEIWAKGEYLSLKALPIAEMQQENILFTQIIDPRNE